MKYNTCIRNLLKLILVLQNNSIDISDISNDCTKPFLGPSILNECYNTRVLTLYTKDGNLFESTFYDTGKLRNSPYFRVQDITDDCCTLLILDNIDGVFISTKQTVVVRLSCICAVKCITDVSVSL